MKYKPREVVNLKAVYYCRIEDYDGNCPLFIEFRDQNLRPNHHIVVVTNYIEAAKVHPLTNFHELCINEKLLSKLNIQAPANDAKKPRLKLVK